MNSQLLIIGAFFMLLVFLAIANYIGIAEARSALPWIAGAFVSELAHMARKTAE